MPPAEDGGSGDAGDREVDPGASDGVDEPNEWTGHTDERTGDADGRTDDIRESDDGVESGDPLDVSVELEADGTDQANTDRPDDSGGRDRGAVGWLLRGGGTGATFLREFLGSVAVVLVVGMLLFAISGVWPPMVAVKSGSMEPDMQRGDLVFVMDENRFPPEVSVEGTGIATYDSAAETGYRRFGQRGDVIIYRQNGNRRTTPIIHRARFWVNNGENWYDRANESFVNGEDCEAIRNCPAPHAGFITKGDNNDRYDQVSGISEPVKPEWVKGTAELRIPWLGHVRLELSEFLVPRAPTRVAG